MVLTLLVSALRIFLLLLLMCTQRRKGRRDQQKVMSTRRRSPRRTRRVKEDKKDKVFGLQSHLESSGRGNSENPSSGIPVSIHIDTIPIPSSQTTQQTQPPITHTSTQIPTPIPSAPLQTETTPIISTTSEQKPTVYLDVSDSEAT